MDTSVLKMAYLLAGNKGHAPGVRQLIDEYEKLKTKIVEYEDPKKMQIDITEYNRLLDRIAELEKHAN